MNKAKSSSVGKMLVLFTAFWIGAASNARADIVFDAAASGQGMGTASWSHTVGNGNNRILVVSFGINFGAPSTPADSVTYAGQALTRVLLHNTNIPISEIWTLIAPPVGTANVVVTHPSGVPIAGGSVSLFGVDQATPVRGSNSTRTTINQSGTASTSVASDTGDVVISMGVGFVDPGTITSAAGQTQRWSQESGSVLKSVGSTKSGELGSTTVGYGRTPAPSTASITVSAISLIPEQLTLAEMVENLTDTVQSYNLHRGIENALLAKLYASLESLSANNVEEARGSLNAFLNQVVAQTGKALTQAQADELRAAAQVILEALG